MQEALASSCPWMLRGVSREASDEEATSRGRDEAAKGLRYMTGVKQYPIACGDQITPTCCEAAFPAVQAFAHRLAPSSRALRRAVQNYYARRWRLSRGRLGDA